MRIEIQARVSRWFLTTSGRARDHERTGEGASAAALVAAADMGGKRKKPPFALRSASYLASLFLPFLSLRDHAIGWV